MNPGISFLVLSLLQYQDDFKGGTENPPSAEVTTADTPPGFPGISFNHGCECGECRHPRTILYNQRYWSIRDKDQVGLSGTFGIDWLDGDDTYYFTNDGDFGKANNQPDAYDARGHWLIRAKWDANHLTDPPAHECGKYPDRYWAEYVAEPRVESLTSSTSQSSSADVGRSSQSSEGASAEFSKKDGPSVGVSSTEGVDTHASWNVTLTTGGSSQSSMRWMQVNAGPLKWGPNGFARMAKCGCGTGKRKIEDQTLDPLVIGKLDEHADDFEITTARIRVQPETQEIVVEFPKPAGDEFAAAQTTTWVVADPEKTANLPEGVVKVEPKPDGNDEVRIDWPELKKADIEAILAVRPVTKSGNAAPSPIEHLTFTEASAGDPAPVDAIGITQVLSLDGKSAPNFTVGGGRIAPMVFRGTFGGRTIALANKGEDGKLTELGSVHPDVVISERDVNHRVLIESVVGPVVGQTKAMATLSPNSFAVLRDADGALNERTARPLRELVPPGTSLASAGLLKTLVEIDPNRALKVGEGYTAAAKLDDSNVAHYALARAQPKTIVEKHLQVNLDINGKRVASGIGRATYQGRAEAPGTIVATGTIEIADRAAMDEEVAEYRRNVSKETASVLKSLPKELSDTARANLERP